MAAIIAGILLATCLLSPLRGFLWIPFGMLRISQRERSLQQSRIYLPASTNLALYCQSVSALNLTNHISGAFLPQPLPSFEHAWGRFETNRAHIEFGGGFHHYGYNLTLDAWASTAQSNLWNLSFCRDGSPDRTLMRFALPSTALLSRGTYLSSALSDYASRIKSNPKDLSSHKGRIGVLLQLDRTKVQEACQEAIRAMPGEWWPRLTLALWHSGQGKPRDAAKELVGYVERKPSYSRYIILAWYYQALEKPDEAAVAMEKAIQFPIIDLSGDQLNTEARGYSAAVYAYRSGKYQTVTKLCDALLLVRANGDYAKPALRSLRAAAQAAQAGQPERFQPDENILGFDPYAGLDLNKLLGR
jgi:hypothetical protein